MHGGREGGTVYWISFYAEISKESEKWYRDGFHGMSIEWRNTKWHCLSYLIAKDIAKIYKKFNSQNGFLKADQYKAK